MAKTPHSDTPTLLPGSWDLVRPSINLIRRNLDTMLWLVIIPGVMSVLGNLLFSRIWHKYFNALSDNPTSGELSTAFHQVTHDLTATSLGQIAVTLLTVSMLWNLLVYPATITFMMRAAQNKDADVISCLRDGFSKFWRLYGVTLATFALVVAGLVLLIIPGFIALRRYFLAPFYVADKQLSITDALKRSAVDSKKFSGYIWGTFGVFALFSLSASLFNTIPYIGFVLGLLATYVYYFGFVLRYQTIAAATGDVSPVTKE